MTVRVDLETAARICGVKPGTIYRWVSDQRITARPGPAGGPNMYDVDELLRWVDARNPDALYLRAGIPGAHADRLSRAAVAKRNYNRVS